LKNADADFPILAEAKKEYELLKCDLRDERQGKQHEA
jgi:hypothetical protein